MFQTTEQDQDERVTDPKLEGQGISWGFSVKGNGDLVVRNWYLILHAAKHLCAVLMFEVTLLIIVLIAINDPDFFRNTTITPSNLVTMLFLGFIALFVLSGGPIALWKIYHESKGILVGKETIIYPVRPGPYGKFPLFRKTIKMDQVLTASPIKIHEAPYEYSHALYLSSDFGVAKLFVDTKGGRDHLYELLLRRFPKIRRYRWT